MEAQYDRNVRQPGLMSDHEKNIIIRYFAADREKWGLNDREWGILVKLVGLADPYIEWKFRPCSPKNALGSPLLPS